MSRVVVRRWSLRLLPLLAACGLTDVEPNAEIDSFVQALDAASFQQVVLSSSAQVSVKLLPGGLTAAAVSVRREGRSDEERIQSKIVALDAASGFFTLMLGDLEIDYGADTRFWAGDASISEAAFIEEVNAILASGHEPAVVVEREAPPDPQAPDNPAFLARDVVLGGEGHPALRMDVDSDNLIMVANPAAGDPDGYIAVLGIQIQLRISDGTTVLEEHDHDHEELEEFEGYVTSVDVSGGSFMIGDILVRLVDRTNVSGAEGHLPGLAEVEAALAGGQVVGAWGVGVVESADPLQLMALKVAFKAKNAEEPEHEEFEGYVSGVDPGASFFELGDGTTVLVTGDTEIVAYNSDSPSSLSEVAEALAAGMEVVAWGYGAFVSDDPLVISGLRVVFKARQAEPDPEPHKEEFEGFVSNIDVSAGTVTFEGGLVVTLSNETEVDGYGDFSPQTLESAFEMLAAGRMIFAWGRGEVTSVDPPEVAASAIVFKAKVEDFEQDVASVDLATRSMVLDNGWIVALSDQTEVLAADNDSPSDLDAAAAAFAAGDRLRVWGIGYVVDYDPVTLELIRITVRKVPPS